MAQDDWRADARSKDSGSRPKNKVVGLLATLVLLLLLAAVGLGVLYYVKHTQSVQMQSLLEEQRDSISRNLEQVLVDYNDLKTDNASLLEKLTDEKARAEKLLAEVKSVKAVSYKKIKEYQKELGTLRAIMRKMVGEIDSLNTLNKELVEENSRVRGEYTEAQLNVQKLSSENETLSEAVQRGSVIQARSISLVGLNGREKVVNKASRTVKLKVCMTLMANPIAKSGSCLVYLRIFAPDGVLLADPEGGIFTLNGETVAYSAVREVEYANADLDLCVFYGEKGTYAKGNYKVEAYIHGSLAGTGEAVLR